MEKGSLRLFAAAVLIAAAVGAAAGCGGDDGEEAAPPTQTGAAVEKSFTIGISHYAQVIPFYRSMTAGFQAAADEYGWELLVNDSNFDPNQQTANIETFISRGVDAIIASPGDANALIPAYKAADDAGIPVVSVANHIASSGEPYQLSFCGIAQADSSAVRTEKLLGEYMNGQGKLIVIRGPSGIAFVQDDKQGFNRVLEKYPDVRVVFEQHAKDLSATEGIRLAEDAFTANPDADGVWVENDDLVVGVARVMKERGVADKVPVIGMDGTPAAMKLIQQGQLTYTLALPTFSWAQDCMEALHAYLVDGTPMPKFVETKIVPATKENVDELLAECDERPNEVWCAKD